MPEQKTDRKIMVEATALTATAAAAKLVRSIVCESVADHGACTIALAGGTTPHALYQSLARTAMNDQVAWPSVEVFFSDERDVPLDDVESNYGMAQRTLLDHVPISPSRVYPMQADSADLDAAAAEYEAIIRDIVPAGADGIPRFDLILLGVGADGHTGSLFPRTAALSETRKLITVNSVPVLGRSRLTMTFPLINAARNVLMLVTGDDKAEMTAKLLGGDPVAAAGLPAAAVAPTNGRLVLVLDAASVRGTGLRPA